MIEAVDQVGSLLERGPTIRSSLCLTLLRGRQAIQKDLRSRLSRVKIDRLRAIGSKDENHSLVGGETSHDTTTMST